MRAKVFSYYTLEERQLLEEAAKQESQPEQLCGVGLS
jgi:hypothetical protein